jgi:hypothetical protein
MAIAASKALLAAILAVSLALATVTTATNSASIILNSVQIRAS